jgi:anti-sigma factor RsiW
MSLEKVEFFTTSDLSAYVDGELENKKKRALGHYIADNPEAKVAVNAYQQQMQYLKKLYGDVNTVH